MSIDKLKADVATAQANLQDLLQLEQYREQREHLFPSLSSLQWWMRSNRRRAIEGGALLLVRGRYHVNPAKMDACIEEAGAEAARRLLVQS